MSDRSESRNPFGSPIGESNDQSRSPIGESKDRSRSPMDISGDEIKSPISETRNRSRSPIDETGDRSQPPITESKDRFQPPINASVDLIQPPNGKPKERSRFRYGESTDRSKSTGENGRRRSRSIGGARDRSRSPIDEFEDETDGLQDDLPTKAVAKRLPKYMQQKAHTAPRKAKNAVSGGHTNLRIYNLTLYSIEDIKEFLREHIPPEAYEDIVYVGYTNTVCIRFGSEKSCKMARDALHNVVYDGQPLYIRTSLWPAGRSAEFLQKEDERKKDSALVFPRKKEVYVERSVKSSYNTYGLSANFLQNLNLKVPLNSKIHVKNLSSAVDKNKLSEVFSHAGTIVRLFVKHEKDSAFIQFKHPLEAVQAISMFRGQSLYGKPMKINMDSQISISQIKVPEGLSSFGPGLGPNGEIMKNLPSVAELLPLREELAQLIGRAKEVLKNGPAQNKPENVVPNKENENQSITQPQNVNANTNAFGNSLQMLLQGLAQATALAGVNNWSNLGPQIAPFAELANVQPFLNVNPQSLNMQLYNTNSQALLNTPLPQNANSQPLNTQPTHANSHPFLNQTLLNTVPLPSLNMQPTYDANAQPSLNMQFRYNNSQLALATQPFDANTQPSFTTNSLPCNVSSQPSLNTQPPLNTNMQSSLNMQLPYNNSQPAFTTNSLPYSANSQEPNNSKQQGTIFSSNHAQLNDAESSHKTKELREGYLSSKRNESEDKPKTSDMLIFTHLPSNVTHHALRRKMSEVGEVKFLEMTEAGKAIVCFVKAQDAERCVRLFDHSRVDGKTIEVKFV